MPLDIYGQHLLSVVSDAYASICRECICSCRQYICTVNISGALFGAVLMRNWVTDTHEFKLPAGGPSAQLHVPFKTTALQQLAEAVLAAKKVNTPKQIYSC